MSVRSVLIVSQCVESWLCSQRLFLFDRPHIHNRKCYRNASIFVNDVPAYRQRRDNVQKEPVNMLAPVHVALVVAKSFHASRKNFGSPDFLIGNSTVVERKERRELFTPPSSRISTHGSVCAPCCRSTTYRPTSTVTRILLTKEQFRSKNSTSYPVQAATPQPAKRRLSIIVIKKKLSPFCRTFLL